MSDRAAKRPLPSREELRVWRSFIETSYLLRGAMDRRMQAAGLSGGDYSVMLALSEAENRTMRSSELAAHIDWDRSRLSHHLGRMEKRGLICRAKCPEDSRGSLIVLTDEGLRLFRRGSVPHLRDVRELFISAFTPEQLDVVAETTRALRAHLEKTLDPRPES